jgi:hypothetical protein
MTADSINRLDHLYSTINSEDKSISLDQKTFSVNKILQNDVNRAKLLKLITNI